MCKVGEHPDLSSSPTCINWVSFGDDQKVRLFGLYLNYPKYWFEVFKLQTAIAAQLLDVQALI
jgi:hypothetical protein